MLHGSLPLGRYCLERYGKPWRVITAEAADTEAESKPAPVTPSRSPCTSPPAVPVPAVPAVVPDGNAARVAAMLAKGRATVAADVDPGPAADSSAQGFTPAPQGFRSWPAVRQRAWVGRNWPELAGADDVDAKVRERLRASK